MFYTDQEKTIYTSPLGRKYDPLDLNNRLEIAAGGNLSMLLDNWWGPGTTSDAKAKAMLDLAHVGRVGFGLKKFDEPEGVLDAVVLEVLYHFLEWLQAKK